jgi:hypothetical protein
MTTASTACSEPWAGPRRWRAWTAALLLCLAGAPSWAHKASDAYLQVQERADGLSLRWDIALRDLDNVLPLDADDDRRLTWREVRSALPQIVAHALDHLQIAGCPLRHEGDALERRSDGVYVAMNFGAQCTPPAGLPMRYTLFGDVDATHRGIARIVHADGRSELRLLDPAKPVALAAIAAASVSEAAPAAAKTPEASTTARPAASQADAPSFIAEGVHHIVTGYDHVLFLLCLLLPAVLRRTPEGWRAVDRWRQALAPVLGIVTLFTVAHSITLALASLNLVSLSPAFIEPAIAVTIIVAALDNLHPVFGRWRGSVTFLFGLVHGFGFAGVLRELQLPPAEFGWALLKFNLGLELGQVAIVAMVVPLLFLQRHRAAYPRWVLGGGSVAAMVVAGLWLVERTADVSLLPV